MIEESALRLMLVDDDEIMLKAAKRFLTREELSFAIAVTLSAAEALQQQSQRIQHTDSESG
ncbi:MAG: hypothetical protein ACXAB4_08165 [Candidatus Hodarchaeales archaeon]